MRIDSNELLQRLARAVRMMRTLRIADELLRSVLVELGPTEYEQRLRGLVEDARNTLGLVMQDTCDVENDLYQSALARMDERKVKVKEDNNGR